MFKEEKSIIVKETEIMEENIINKDLDRRTEEKDCITKEFGELKDDVLKLKRRNEEMNTKIENLNNKRQFFLKYV